MGRSRGGLTTKIHALVNENGLPLRYLLTPGQEQGAVAVIPSKSNRKLPKDFDKALYKNRNHIERFFGRIKRSFRRSATRYDKTSRNVMAFINLATLRLWCQYYESAP
jgi:transposase